MVDYRKLRLSNITSPMFRHLFLLIYWPIYGVVFYFLERGWKRDYIPVECFIDDYIHDRAYEWNAEIKNRFVKWHDMLYREINQLVLYTD